MQSELTIKGFFLFPGLKLKLLQTQDKHFYLLILAITLVEATDACETGSSPAAGSQIAHNVLTFGAALSNMALVSLALCEYWSLCRIMHKLRQN